jgi:hypothetical protein
MYSLIPDTTLAELYTKYGTNSPLVIDLHPPFTHIDIHPSLPRESVFIEDEDPNIYGQSLADLHNFRRRILCFQTILFIKVIGPADVILHLTDDNDKESIQRALEGLPPTQRARPVYVDLDSPSFKNDLNSATKGKKLVYWKPKAWMNDHECLVPPHEAYIINDKRYLSHPSIPTATLQMLSVDDPVLKNQPAPFVVKFCKASMANGTFIVRTEENREKMLVALQRYQDRGGKEVQLSDFIKSTRPSYGVNFFVGRYNRNHPLFTGATEQVFSSTGAWAGGIIDYSIQNRFEEEFRATINAVANSLPDSYVGTVGIDVIFDLENKPLVVDLNARLNGGLGLIFYSKHFLQRGFAWAQSMNLQYGGKAALIYDVLSEKLESGQVVVSLAADISEHISIAGLVIGARSRNELNDVREWIEDKLSTRL